VQEPYRLLPCLLNMISGLLSSDRLIRSLGKQRSGSSRERAGDY
jgi:hypothetical protein